MVDAILFYNLFTLVPFTWNRSTKNYNVQHLLSYYLMIYYIMSVSVYYSINVGIVAPEAVIIQPVAHDEIVRNIHGHIFYVQINFQLIGFHQ